MKRITEKFIKNNLKTLFVFGDNVIEKGTGGQAKVCRFNHNCLGLPTKRLPSMYAHAFFYDSTLKENKEYIDRAYSWILTKLEFYDRLIIFPNIGLGFAKLDVTAPKTYKHLVKVLNKLKKETKYVEYTKL